MQVFKIGDAIANQYRGCGHAIAAVANGEVVALRYLWELIPDYPADATAVDFQEAMNDPMVGSATREIRDKGDIYAGMCSCYEFVVL
jgi:hypothetical protein